MSQRRRRYLKYLKQFYSRIYVQKMCAYEYEEAWRRMFVIVLFIITEKLERSQIFVTKIS